MRSKLTDASYDAIVIGSGARGLTSAVLLAKHAGKRVLVLERAVAGGFLATSSVLGRNMFSVVPK